VRWRALRQLERRLEIPMAILGLVWLGIFVLDMTVGLTPLLAALSTAVWILFIGDFVVRLMLAPDRLVYVRRNWLTALRLPADHRGHARGRGRHVRSGAAQRG